MIEVMKLAWQQLSFHRMKLIAAVSGVVVAVMLMLVQLGIRDGAMENSVAFPRRITGDLVVLGPRTKTMFQSSQFPRVLLYRLAAHDAVAEVSPVYMSAARWKNSWEFIEHPISIYGVEPESNMINLPGYSERAVELRLADRFLFDTRNRSNYGPVVDALKTGEVVTEINGRRIHVIGAINVGISIANDGNIYSTPTNFLRLFPGRSPGSIDLGLVRLKPNVDAQKVKEELLTLLGTEAKILTNKELVESEVKFLRDNAPIDFIFGLGAAIGFFIGFVVVYQILYTEVTNRLPQLATLKAIGFTDRYLLKLVLSQAILLSILGYVPGFLLALWLYGIASQQIQMPFEMTWERGTFVFVATLLMCAMSAAIAIRKAWSADPAEVF